MCASVDLWVPLSRDGLRCPSIHFFPNKTTGYPMFWYCLRRRRAGCSNPPRSVKSPCPRLSLTKPSHPKSLTSSAS